MYEKAIELLADRLYITANMKRHNICPEYNDIRDAECSGIAVFIGDLYGHSPYDVMYEAKVFNQNRKVT